MVLAFLTAFLGAGETAPSWYFLESIQGVTSISSDDPWVITAFAPAGDQDADGLEDILIRLTNGSSSGDLDQVFLLYGQPIQGGTIALPSDRTARKTLIRLGGGNPVQIAWNVRGHIALDGGKDVNGDGRPDLLIASSSEIDAQGPGILLLSPEGPLPNEFDTTSIPGRPG